MTTIPFFFFIFHSSYLFFLPFSLPYPFSLLPPIRILLRPPSPPNAVSIMRTGVPITPDLCVIKERGARQPHQPAMSA